MRGINWAGGRLSRQDRFYRQSLYYRIRQGRLRTVRTRNGSQRVLWSSVQALLRERDDEFDLVSAVDGPDGCADARL